MPRNSGCESPFHLLQVLSWILFAVDLICIYMIIIPLLAEPYRIISGIVSTLSCALVAYFCLRVTVSVPTDYSGLESTREDRIFCTICMRSVDASSKHCMKCNRCIERFDHHCKWVNNCIGLKNYKHFVAFIVSVAFMYLFLFLQSFYLIFWALTTYEDFSAEINELYDDTSIVALIILFIVCTHSFIFFLFDLLLILFHVWLSKKQLTTFEFIKSRRKKEKKISVEVKNVSFDDKNSEEKSMFIN